MADSTTPFGTISTGQGNQEAKANGLFDAVSPGALFGLNYATTSGTTLGYHGGKIISSGALLVITAGTINLTPSATNYVEAHPDTGVVSKNTTAYTHGYVRIGRAVVGSSSITTWYDDRYYWTWSGKTLAKMLPSDANYTLTADEADNCIYEISGTLTATRNITIPLVGKRQTTCVNKTGQSLQFIGPTGTGVTVATSKTAIVRSDGTNIVRVTADA